MEVGAEFCSYAVLEVTDGFGTAKLCNGLECVHTVNLMAAGWFESRECGRAYQGLRNRIMRDTASLDHH